MFVIKKRGVGYLRFLNSFIPSISVMYSNPFSISCWASAMLVAVLQCHSSSSLKAISWVYRSVCLRSLCPSCCLTYRMSFVL